MKLFYIAKQNNNLANLRGLYARQQANRLKAIWKLTTSSTCCRVPNAADTGCGVLEFGECQPQCRNQQHKMIQQRLMLSSDYHTHTVKTKKGKLQCARLKVG